MTPAAVTADVVLAAARRALNSLGPGVTNEQAVVVGYAEVAGEPLDPWRFDDAALVLRAERLLLDGLPVADAVHTARTERATWNTSTA